MKRRSDLGLGRAPTAASSDCERQVAAIFGEFLEVDTVGVEDELFELGGDSFIVLQISLAIGERLGHEVDSSRIAELGTVRRLCADLDLGT